MADNLMKNLRKKTMRTKESLRETFGKADRTTDEQFEENCNEFSKQQKNAERLQKELKNYTTCLKALSTAGKGLNEAIREIYESQWDGIEHVKADTHSLDLLWDDYLEKLNEEALNPLNNYCNQFIDIKAKIAKRGRKLVDYDAARHAYDSVLASAKKDEAKVQKAKEQLNIAKKLYDDLNNELLTALPDLYESRVEFFLRNFKTIFNAEHAFHDETAKLDKDILAEMIKMKIDGGAGGDQNLKNLHISTPKTTDSLKKQNVPPKDQQQSSPIPSPPVSSLSLNTPQSKNQDSKPSPKPVKAPRTYAECDLKTSPIENNGGKTSENDSTSANSALYPTILKDGSPLDESNPFSENTPPVKNGVVKDENGLSSAVPEEPAAPVIKDTPISDDRKSATIPSKDKDKAISNDKNAPTSNDKGSTISTDKDTTVLKDKDATISDDKDIVVKPRPAAAPKILYKVKATHRYSAEDTDELTFDKDDVLLVVEPTDPDELDEGWLMGMKESSGESGVFPANFTKPL